MLDKTGRRLWSLFLLLVLSSSLSPFSASPTAHATPSIEQGRSQGKETDIAASSSLVATFPEGNASLPDTRPLGPGAGPGLVPAAGSEETPGGEACLSSSTLPSPTVRLYLPLLGKASPAYGDTALVTPEGGGILRSFDGRVIVSFPPGAVTETVVVSYRPLPAEAFSLTLTPHCTYSLFFELRAHAQSDGREVRTFREPVQVQVHYTVEDLRANGWNELLLTLYTWEDGYGWVPLPRVGLDMRGHALTSQTRHFSGFGLGDIPEEPDQAYIPGVQGFEVGLFSGAAQVSYPLRVPAGNAGLTPRLQLGYSSSMADGETGFSPYNQGSWVGWGWNLEMNSIAREKYLKCVPVCIPEIGCDWCGDQEYYDGGDTFSLVLNGTSSDLVPVGGGDYRTADETFWKIHYDAGSDTWTVWTKDGTRYTFAERARWGIYKGTMQDPTPFYEVETYQWFLSEVRDTHGNTISYTYTHEGETIDGWFNTTATYLQEIAYGGSDNHRYRIVFELSQGDRQDLPPWQYQQNALHVGHTAHMHRHLSRIWVYADGQVVRRYELRHDYSLHPDNPEWDDHVKLTLLGITLYGADGHPLPSYTFSYDTDAQSPNRNRLVRACNGYGGCVRYVYEDVGYNRRRVVERTIEDGQGNAYTYRYAYGGVAWNTPDVSACVAEHQDDVGGTAGHLWWHRPGSEFRGHAWVSVEDPAGRVTVHAFHQDDFRKGKEAWVEERGNSPEGPLYRRSVLTYGVENTVAEVQNPHRCMRADFVYQEGEEAHTYDGPFTPVYTEAPWEMVYNADFEAVGDEGNPALSGWTRYGNNYAWVLDGVGVGGSQGLKLSGPTPEHGVFQVLQRGGIPLLLPGKTYRITAQVRADSENIQARIQLKADDGNGGNAVATEPLSPPTSWITLTLDYTAPASGRLRLIVHCIPADNKPIYVDNVRLFVREVEGSTLRRRTTYTYEPTYGNQTEVREYDENGNLYRSTLRGYYPNEGKWIVGLAGYENVYAGAPYPEGSDWRSSTYYAYDYQAPFKPPEVGNLTRERRVRYFDEGTYRAYTVDTAYEYDERGNRTAQTTYGEEGWYQSKPPVDHPAEAEPATTRLDYQDYLFPVRLTYPAVNGRVMSATAAYDGRFGVPTLTVGVNGERTRADYDEYGRIVKVWKPGDEGFAPTAVFTYSDFLSPTQVAMARRVDAGGPTLPVYRRSFRFYDGMGRLIQTQEEAERGQCILASKAYDERGLVKWESVPYFGACGTYQAPSWGTLLHTAYAYDLLGRTVAVTSTDGTVVRTAYRGWEEAVLDTNGHQKVSRKDAFGRLVSVSEYTGEFPSPNFDAPPYATTRYGYDVLDQLVAVTDTAGNITRIFYNPLGQKEAMDDPDMGHWEYDYDPRGNLVAQRDNRGRTLSFDYDLLNRLVAKRSLTETLALYTYDEGPNGRMKRTGMEDLSGQTRWGYDMRGRPVWEEHTIVGAPQVYTLGYRYNDADQVVALIYPDGEVVTTTYNIRGLPTALTGMETYVQGSTYNALGQRRSLTLGNGVQTAYTYYGDGASGAPSFRLAEIRVTVPGGAERLDLHYEYDAVGNITRITDDTNGGQALFFAYDALNRLTHAWTNGAGQGTFDFWYGYDPLGNIDYWVEGGVTVDYTYGSSRPHAVTQAGTHTYGYDGNGNMVRRDGQVLTYDLENRLVRVVSGTAVTEYLYDGDGNRVAMREPAGTTYYVGDIYEEFVPSGALRRAGGEEVPHIEAVGKIVGRVDNPTYPRREGEGVVAEGRGYRAEFTAGGVHFVTAEGAGLTYRLAEVRSTSGVVWTAEAVSPEVREDRVVYGRPGLREEYVLLGTGLEQVFVVEAWPSGGDLEVVGEVETSLLAELAPEGVRFRSGGKAAITYGRALVYDASGRWVEAELRLEREPLRLVIVVPGEWLREARYPVTIDPAVEGAEEVVSTPPLTPTVPLGVEASWWAKVQADLGEQEYQVSLVDGAYQSPNRAHNFRTYFEEGGVRVVPRTGEEGWEWRWALSGWGRAGAMEGAGRAAPVVSGNRVEYRRPGLVEWYENGRQGLKQGFTVLRRPGGEGPLLLEARTPLEVVGEDEAVLRYEGRRVLYYGGLSVRDARGQAVEAHLEECSEGLRLVIRDAGHPYPLYVDPLVSAPSWTAEGDQAGAHFGFAVAAAGDVNGDGYDDVIVGAPDYDSGQADEGKVFVYYGSSSGPSPAPSWTAEGNQTGAYFGRVVGTAGDVDGDGCDDIFVAAIGYDSPAYEDAGAVFVWYGCPLGSNGTPDNADWKAMGEFGGSSFGRSVGAGDVNGDGYSDLGVGLPLDGSGEIAQGKVFVYYGSGAGLPATANWEAVGSDTYGHLGVAVTIGDVNGDGCDDILVGAGRGAVGHPNKRVVFIWYGCPLGENGIPGNADWMAEILNAGNDARVVGTGDVNGDSCADVIVGADEYDNGQANEGAVFVWHGCPLGDPGTPGNADWMAESDQTGAYFGASAGTAGDVNGDGFDDVIVGAGWYDDGEIDEGAVFVWYGSAAGLGEPGTPENADWKAEGNQAGAYFGASAGAAGDVNNDGYDDVIIGAEGYDHGQADEGMAFVYLADELPPWNPTRVVETHGAPNDAWQHTVSDPRFTWSGAGDDVSGVRGYYWYFGKNSEAEPTTWTTEEGADPPAVSDGTYYLRVKTEDNVGHVSAPATLFTFKYDGTPPSSRASSPAYDNGATIPVTWTAGDATSGVERTTLWYRCNDSPWTKTPLSGSGTSGTFYFAPQNGDGTYYFATQAVDRAGNVEPAPTGNGDSRTIYDTISPTVQNLQAFPNPFSPNGDGVKDTITITAKVEDANFLGWTLVIPGTDCSYHGTTPQLQVVWDGEHCTSPSGSVFSVPYDVYDVRITAYDRAGNSSITHTVIVLDTLPPTLTVTLPPQPAYTHHDHLLVAGGTDSTANTITVNGKVITHTTEAFSATVAVTLGWNLLTVVATDPAGNSTIVTRTVLYEEEAPLVFSYAPTGAISDGLPLLTAAFSDTGGSGVDTEAVTVTLDGVDLTARAVVTPGGLSVRPTWALAEGSHTARVQVADRAGNVGERVWNFSVDRSTELEVAFPFPGMLLNTWTVTVTGWTEAGNIVSLATGGGFFTRTTALTRAFSLPEIPLLSGTNLLVLTATDGLGNRATASLAVKVDPTRPAGGLSASPNPFSPNGDKRLDRTSFRLYASPPEGAAPAGWALVIADREGEVRRFEGEGLPPLSLDWDGTDEGGWVLPDGAYSCTLHLAAVAISGSVVLTTTVGPYAVVLDTVPPEAPAVDFPPPGKRTYYSQGSALVWGTAEPGSVVTLLDGGRFTATVEAGEGKWVQPFPLAFGENRLWALATDAAGNVSIRSFPPSMAFLEVEPPLYAVGVFPAWAGCGMTVEITATSRGEKPWEGAPTRAVTATIPLEGGGEAVIPLVRPVEPSGIMTYTWEAVYQVTEEVLEGWVPVGFRAVDGAIPPKEGRGVTFFAVDCTPPPPPVLEGPLGVVYTRGEAPLYVHGRADPYIRVRVHLLSGEVSLITMTTRADALGHFSLDFPLDGVEEGRYRLGARAVDRVGNVSDWSNFATIVVDRTPPVVEAEAVPGYIRAGGNERFSAQVVEENPLRRVGVEVLGAYLAMGWEGGEWAVWWTVGGDVPEGRHPIAVTAEDMAGNVGEDGASFVVDNTPPSGTMLLAGGRAYVSTTQVLAALTATDAYTVGALWLRNDGGAWMPVGITPAPVVVVEVPWTLWEEDGERTVYGRLRDLAGNEAVVSDSVFLDRRVPEGSFLIAGGAPWARQVTVTLTVDAEDRGSGLEAMRFRNADAGGGWSAWEAYARTKVWVLSAGDGEKRVEAQVRDRAGNVATFSDTIGLDTRPPVGSLLIEGGAEWVNHGEVVLTIAAEDGGSGVVQMRLRNAGEAWGSWEPYAGTRLWTLSTGDGEKVVEVQVRDLVGNEGVPFSDTIGLDTIPPQGSASSPAYANAGPIQVSWTAGDERSGVERTALWYKFNGGTWTDSGLPHQAGTSGTFAFTPPSGDGTYYFAMRSVDRAGNMEAAPSGGGDASTVYDTVPPTSRVLPLPPLSMDPEIVVEWIGEDSTSGLAAYDVQVQVDGGAWQDWRVGVTETSGVYVGTLGHTYAFRSRGHDRAGNVEAWPAVPDAQTKVVARVRKTYAFGGMPVAVRLHPEGGSAGVLVYLHADHLGSPVVATDGGGDVVAEVRYYPYGGTRYQMGEMPTTLNFTGQRLDAGVGLLYYRARYYDPVLGRFVQPDTVVPNLADPQGLNRYAYVRNNPVRYIDPSGHIEEDEAEEAQKIHDYLLATYGIEISQDWGWRTRYEWDDQGNLLVITEWDPGAWSLEELGLVQQAVEDFATKLGGADKFRKLVGPVCIKRVRGGWDPEGRIYGCRPAIAPPYGRTIKLYDPTFTSGDSWAKRTIVHELAHMWDWNMGWWVDTSRWPPVMGIASAGLEDFVDEPAPTEYAGTHPIEHWAETVALWVYPEYGKLGPQHELYILALIAVYSNPAPILERTQGSGGIRGSITWLR